MGALRTFGNVVWVVFGGFEMFLFYVVQGLAACATLIGIPYGVQLFKLSLLSLWPFGKEVIDDPDPTCGPGMSLFLNIVCLIFSLPIVLSHLLFALLFFITIVGMPFGYQHWKLAKLALWPFGKYIVDIDTTEFLEKHRLFPGDSAV